MNNNTTVILCRISGDTVRYLFFNRKISVNMRFIIASKNGRSHSQSNAMNPLMLKLSNICIFYA